MAYAFFLHRQNRYHEAETTLVNLIKLHPKAGGPRLSLAKLMVDTQRDSEAEKHIKRGLRDNRRDPELHLYYAQFLSRTDRPKLAIKHFKSSLKHNPDNLRALFSYGIHLSNHGMKEQAQELLERVAELDNKY
jgi:predicted Zn-dependent protease